MQSFADVQGRQWHVDINVAAIKRVKARLKIDLLEAFTGKLLQELSVNPVLLVDLLFVLCEAQAGALGVTDEQFGEAMAGDAIAAATDAFAAALVDFSPSPRARASLTEIRRLSKEAESKAHDLIDAKLKTINVAELAASAIHQTQVKFGDSFTNAPESQVSTPIPSLSAN